MDFNFSAILSGAVGIIMGVIVALRVIAPKTKTTVDDEVLRRLEQLEKLLPKP